MAKNFDTDFIMNFIQECGKEGFETAEEICFAATRRISEIDEKIKLRIKYMDVIKFLNQKIKKIEKSEENFDLKSIDKNISDIVIKSIPISTENLLKSINEVKEENVICAVKTLIEKKVLVRENNMLDRGLNFDLYDVENK
jgi:hypothetical protein